MSRGRKLFIEEEVLYFGGRKYIAVSAEKYELIFINIVMSIISVISMIWLTYLTIKFFSYEVVAESGLWFAAIYGAIYVWKRGVSVQIFTFLAILTIILRILMFSISDNSTLQADSLAYMKLAHSIIDKKGLVTGDGVYGGNLRSMYPPFYPVILAGLGKIVGLSREVVLSVNVITDLVSAYVIYRLGTMIGQRDHGRIAAALFFMWPAFILAAPIPQKESLSTLLVLMILLSFVSVVKQHDRRKIWPGAVGLGVSTGLLALTQPALATLPASLGIVLAIHHGFRRILALALLSIPFAVIVMLPWWIRNWELFHSFVPLTTSAGHSMILAATGGWVSPPPEVALLNEPERSSAMGRVAIDIIRSDPLNYLANCAKRVARAFAVDDFGSARYLSVSPPLPDHLLRPLRMVEQLAYTTVTILAAARYRLRDRNLPIDWPTLFLVAAFLHIAIFGIWFEFGVRHRYFMMPVMLLVAAKSISQLAARVRGGQ